MDLSSPSTHYALFWTIMRLLALGVLATEALFLLRRARRSPAEGTPASRLVWSATPAALLLGLSFWCLSALPAPRSSAPAAAQASLTPHR